MRLGSPTNFTSLGTSYKTWFNKLILLNELGTDFHDSFYVDALTAKFESVSVSKRTY